MPVLQVDHDRRAAVESLEQASPACEIPKTHLPSGDGSRTVASGVGACSTLPSRSVKNKRNGGAANNEETVPGPSQNGPVPWRGHWAELPVVGPIATISLPCPTAL